MLSRHILCAVALATGVSAKSLYDVVSSQNSTLSRLGGFLNAHPEILKILNSATNVTFLAPSNEAFSAFLNDEANKGLFEKEDALRSFISYHLLDGTLYGSDFDNAKMFVPTRMDDQAFTNVTGGQVVEASALSGDKVSIYSGLRQSSTLTRTNLNFTGGTIHVIDRVLDIPSDLSTSLVATGLSATQGAMNQAGTDFSTGLNTRKDVTVFAPSNSAFAAIANVATAWDPSTIANILDYHVLDGFVGYSNLLTNNSVARTVNGGSVTCTLHDGSLFVNAARVIEADVIIANGIMHIIDDVLNPDNTALPDPNASVGKPAYSGASSADSDNVPFTKGVPTPTSVVPAATGTKPPPTSSTTAAAAMAAVQSGAVGMVALFGGAAILANL